MSGPRRLWVRIRRVEPDHFPAYREAVTAAGVRAGEIGAHFWAFEADGGEGRFVEFLEGPGDEVLRALLEATDESLHTASGESGTSDILVGPRGLRCTEFA